ncbi:MAG: calcium-binding protein, partial [Planctomycetota bacterium]
MSLPAWLNSFVPAPGPRAGRPRRSRRSRKVPETAVPLEARTMLSGYTTAFDAGTGELTVTGTSAADTLTLLDVGGYMAIDDGSTTVSTGHQVAAVTGLIVNAGDGNDVITIDASLGTIPATLLGEAGDDTLTGGSGDDVIKGGAGADALSGGDGDDVLNYDSDDATLGSLDGGGGHDEAETEWHAAAGTLAIAGTDLEVINGTQQDDVLDATGVTYSVTLKGGGGADVLIGGDGDDTLEYDNDDATLGTLDGGAGYDVAQTHAYTAAAVTVDVSTTSGLEEIRGTNQEDVLDASGVAYDVILIGRGGADTLIGGDGDDTLVFDEHDVANGLLLGGGGYDTAERQSWGVGAISITLAGTGIESISASRFGDTLDATGTTESVLLDGYSGDDVLIGGSA